MNQRSLAALIALNVVLLAALVVTVFSPQPAQAQFGGSSQYLMISGEVAGRTNQSGVYIINLQTSRMIAVLFNSSNNKLEYIDSRDISRDGSAPIRRR